MANSENNEEQIKFTLDADLKKRFQLWCIQQTRKRKMSDVLREMIEQLVEPPKTDPSQEWERAKRFFQTLAAQKNPTNADIVLVARSLDIDTEVLMIVCDCFLEERANAGRGH